MSTQSITHTSSNGSKPMISNGNISSSAKSSTLKELRANTLLREDRSIKELIDRTEAIIKAAESNSEMNSQSLLITSGLVSNSEMICEEQKTGQAILTNRIRCTDDKISKTQKKVLAAKRSLWNSMSAMAFFLLKSASSSNSSTKNTISQPSQSVDSNNPIQPLGPWHRIDPAKPGGLPNSGRSNILHQMNQPILCAYGDPDGRMAGDRESSGPENSCTEYSRDRETYFDGFPKTDWSQDPRWQKAEWERYVGNSYNDGVYDHIDEGVSSILDGRLFAGRDEFINAVKDALTSQGRWTEANRLENQIAQDASRESADHTGGGCLIL